MPDFQRLTKLIVKHALVDAHILGIDSLAIDSFPIPIPRKKKLEDLPKVLRPLFEKA